MKIVEVRTICGWCHFAIWHAKSVEQCYSRMPACHISDRSMKSDKCAFANPGLFFMVMDRQRGMCFNRQINLDLTTLNFNQGPAYYIYSSSPSIFFIELSNTQYAQSNLISQPTFQFWFHGVRGDNQGCPRKERRRREEEIGDKVGEGRASVSGW